MLPVLSRRPRDLWGPDGLASFFPGLFEVEERSCSAAALDILETADGYELRLDVPGVAKEDLKVSVEDDVLTVAGARKAPAWKEGGYARTERWSGEFARTVTLSSGLDASKLAASLKDGVLTLSIPRAESAKPREISIQ